MVPVRTKKADNTWNVSVCLVSWHHKQCPQVSLSEPVSPTPIDGNGQKDGCGYIHPLDTILDINQESKYNCKTGFIITTHIFDYIDCNIIFRCNFSTETTNSQAAVIFCLQCFKTVISENSTLYHYFKRSWAHKAQSNHNIFLSAMTPELSSQLIRYKSTGRKHTPYSYTTASFCFSLFTPLSY